MALTRDQIMARRETPLRTEKVAVPEWGGDVIVREMSGRERDAFEATFVDDKGRRRDDAMHNIRARLVAAVCVDDKGQTLFYPSDVELLADLSAAALDRVFTVARQLSGFTERDIDDLAKN
jgi:hypothetical protein